MHPHRESLPRRVAREYMILRLGGHRSRHSRWGYGRPPSRWTYTRSPGWGTTHWPRHHRGSSGVQVRGCGCCLPIPLALAPATAVGLRAVSKGSKR